MIIFVHKQLKILRFNHVSLLNYYGQNVQLNVVCHIGSLFFNRIFYTRYFRTWDNIFNNSYVNRYFHMTTGACETVYQSFEM